MCLANVGRGRIWLGLGVGMIDSKDVPAIRVLDLANDSQQFERVSHITGLGRGVNIRHRENPESASFLAADHAPGFVGCVASSLGDKLIELVRTNDHLRFPICGFRSRRVRDFAADNSELDVGRENFTWRD